MAIDIIYSFILGLSTLILYPRALSDGLGKHHGPQTSSAAQSFPAR